MILLRKTKVYQVSDLNFSRYYKPHQIQCPGCPEHPSQPLGLPEISDWEPEGLS